MLTLLDNKGQWKLLGEKVTLREKNRSHFNEQTDFILAHIDISLRKCSIHSCSWVVLFIIVTANYFFFFLNKDIHDNLQIISLEYSQETSFHTHTVQQGVIFYISNVLAGFRWGAVQRKSIQHRRHCAHLFNLLNDASRNMTDTTLALHRILQHINCCIHTLAHFNTSGFVSGSWLEQFWIQSVSTYSSSRKELGKNKDYTAYLRAASVNNRCLCATYLLVHST